jgi:hypothetical protein
MGMMLLLALPLPALTQLQRAKHPRLSQLEVCLARAVISPAWHFSPSTPTTMQQLQRQNAAGACRSAPGSHLATRPRRVALICQAHGSHQQQWQAAVGSTLAAVALLAAPLAGAGPAWADLRASEYERPTEFGLGSAMQF